MNPPDAHRTLGTSPADSNVVNQAGPFRLRSLVLFLLAIAAIGPPGAEAQGDRVPTLRVGTSGDYPPFSRATQGFDIDLARLMAADLGVQVVWVPFTWPKLTEQVARDDFDVAMGGITWRAERAAVGTMTRAVAQGAPCVVGDQTPDSVAVNRGGILERFARQRFGDGKITTTDDNLELPRLLGQGQIEAFITDSFEVLHFAGETPFTCEPARDRKVYWVAPQQAGIAARIDLWLADNEVRIAELRKMHFGDPQHRGPEHHLVDLLARRFAFMPHVARYKKAHSIAITDAAQEARILEGAARAAAEHGLDTGLTRELFELLIELAKKIQERTPPGSASLDLTTQIRPALVRLTPRLLDALTRGVDETLLTSADLEAPLLAWLEIEELRSLQKQLARF